jgi:hypothetical protein
VLEFGEVEGLASSKAVYEEEDVQALYKGDVE